MYEREFVKLQALWAGLTGKKCVFYIAPLTRPARRGAGAFPVKFETVQAEYVKLLTFFRPDPNMPNFCSFNIALVSL